MWWPFGRRDTYMMLSIPPPIRQRFDKIKRHMGVSDDVELIRRALAVLSTVTEVEARGGRVLVEEPDGEIKQLQLTTSIDT